MKIQVQYDQLRASGSVLNSKAQEYQATIATIQSKMQEISTVWQGNDSAAFTSQAASLQPKLEQMVQAIEQYAQLLNSCASTYESVMENRMAMARNLAV
jgi:WXG100 family type VII secretion target